MPTISDYIQDINRRIFLPGLQREFVWSKQQTADLFDSLIREYPVGMITRWDVAHSDAEYYPYKFIQRFVDDERAVPNAVEDAGYHRYNEEVEEGTEDSTLSYLVIDGQQRLTSLFIGLFGQRLEYTKGSGGKRSTLGHWSAYELCINLFGHPDYDNEGLVGDYEFKFRRTGKYNGPDQTGYFKSDDGIERYWFPLPRMMTENRRERNSQKVTNEINDDIADISATDDRKQLFKNIHSKVLPQIQSRILDAELPEKDVKKSSSEIKEIFKRINTAGEKPDPYQLLLSRMMSTWPFTDPEDKKINPRQKTENWVEDFKQSHEAYEKKIGREIFMRYSVYLIDDVLKTQPVGRLSDEDLLEIRENWTKDPEGSEYSETHCHRFRDALDDAFTSLTTLGFSADTMNTMPIIATLGKFYYEHPEADCTGEENLEQIYRFVSQLRLLKKSKGSISRVQATRVTNFLHKNRDEHYPAFPADEAFNYLDVGIARETVADMVQNARYGSGNVPDGQFSDWEVAAILNLSTPTFEHMDVDSLEVDHIFPVSKVEKIASEADIDEDGLKINRVGNLQLLPAPENRQKSDKLPLEWIDSMSEAEVERYKRINNYPDEQLVPSRFLKFVEKREKELVKVVTEEIQE